MWESACNAGDPGSVPGLGRSPGEGNGNPLQYSCLGNHMDRGAWRAAIHGIAKSWTRCVTDFHFHFFTFRLENMMTEIRNLMGLPRWRSVSQLSRSVLSDSLWPHEPQHARLPCPSSTPGACLLSCSLSQWCHPTISSSVVPFSSCLQSLTASGSFPMSQFFESGDQRIGVSASASVLPMNIQDWFPLGWTGWISL